MINHIFLLGKYYLYRRKCNGTLPSLKGFIARLKRVLGIELYVAWRRRNKLISHHKKWLTLPTHESKTTGHKFNGRKGVGDEVLELPIGIMQDNTQVSWLATRGLSPLPQGPWEQTQQHALYWGPNAQGLWEQTNQHPLVPKRLCWGPNPQGLWEQTKQHPLVPRLCWGPNPQGLWEQTQQCALVPRLCWPLGTITTTTTTLGVPLSQES